MALIAQRVAELQAGKNAKAICRMPSGWAVIGDVQFLLGYCLLLPDPVVPSLNDLAKEKRLQFLNDMTMIGDALLEVTGARRINYEILGNSEPELHAHIFPRFDSEPDDKRRLPVWFYDWQSAPRFEPAEHGILQARIREQLQRKLTVSANQAMEGNH